VAIAQMGGMHRIPIRWINTK